MIQVRKGAILSFRLPAIGNGFRSGRRRPCGVARCSRTAAPSGTLPQYGALTARGEAASRGAPAVRTIPVLPGAPVDRESHKARTVDVQTQSEVCDYRFDARAAFVSLYLCAIIALGTAIFAWAALSWYSEDHLRFTSFLIAAVIASILKIRLPGLTETASVSVVVISAAIAHLSLSESVVISALAMLAQCTLQTRARPKAIQVAFNVCALAISVCASALVFGFARTHAYELPGVVAIAFVYF